LAGGTGIEPVTS